MSAFTTPTTPLLFHIPFHGTICPQRPSRRYPLTTMLTAPAMRVPSEGEAPEFEDDDATMGESTPSYGIRLPNFTKKDQEYLDSASTTDEYIARMTELAKQKDMERKIANAKSGAQTADDYVESLRRKPQDLSDLPYDSKGTSAANDYMDSLNVRQPPDLSGGSYDSKGVNAGEEYIQQLTAMHESSARDEPHSPQSESSPDGATKSAEHVKDFQAFLRQSAGVDDNDLSPENSVDMDRINQDIEELEARLKKVVYEENPDGSPAVSTAEDVEKLDDKFKEIREQMPGFSDESKSSAEEPAEDVAVVDKQIGFLESYLEKLKREQAEETGETFETSDAESDDINDDGGSQENPMDEETANEEQPERMQDAGMKKDADKEEMRGKLRDTMRMLSDKVREQPGGSSGTGGSTGEMSEKEKMEAFEAIRRQVMKQRGEAIPEYADPLAAPLPEKKSDVSKMEEDDEDIDTGSTKMSSGYFVISEVEAEIKKYLFDARSMLDDHERRMRSLMRKLRDLE